MDLSFIKGVYGPVVVHDAFGMGKTGGLYFSGDAHHSNSPPKKQTPHVIPLVLIRFSFTVSAICGCYTVLMIFPPTARREEEIDDVKSVFCLVGGRHIEGQEGTLDLLTVSRILPHSRFCAVCRLGRLDIGHRRRSLS